MRTERLLRETIQIIIQEDRDRIGAIYCDMDGVLVDFETKALTLLQTAFRSHPDSVWSTVSKTISDGIDEIRSLREDDWLPKSQHDLDDPLVKLVMIKVIGFDPGSFFAELQPYEDAGVLWDFLNRLGPPVHILSAPINQRKGMGTSARDGKESWVKKHLVPQPASVIITPTAKKKDKAFDKVKGRPNLLIDDREDTIDSWIAAGGIGILHIPGDSARTMLMIQKLLGRD